MQELLTLLTSYTLGSISCAALAGRLAGLDVSGEGSGNLGALNSLRVLGPRWAAVVLLGDLLKGSAAAAIGGALVGGSVGLLLGIWGAVAGHNFSIFLAGRGGKGLATMLGGYLVLSPVASLGGVSVAAAVLAAGAGPYVAATVGLVSVPIWTYLATGATAPVILGALIALTSLLRHVHHLPGFDRSGR